MKNKDLGAGRRRLIIESAGEPLTVLLSPGLFAIRHTVVARTCFRVLPQGPRAVPHRIASLSERSSKRRTESTLLGRMAHADIFETDCAARGVSAFRPLLPEEWITRERGVGRPRDREWVAPPGRLSPSNQVSSPRTAAGVGHRSPDPVRGPTEGLSTSHSSIGWGPITSRGGPLPEPRDEAPKLAGGGTLPRRGGRSLRAGPRACPGLRRRPDGPIRDAIGRTASLPPPGPSLRDVAPFPAGASLQR